jgi:hypothetical protein
MIVDKFGNYVRNCVGGVGLTFHMRAFDFFIKFVKREIG